MHIKSRTTPYLNGPERFYVPDNKVLWKVPFLNYDPINYTAQSVENKPIWADNNGVKNCKFNNIDGKINRISYNGVYEINLSGYPLSLYSSLVLCVANSGFSISSNLSAPTCASQRLNGSAFGEGIL